MYGWCFVIKSKSVESAIFANNINWQMIYKQSTDAYQTVLFGIDEQVFFKLIRGQSLLCNGLMGHLSMSRYLVWIYYSA